MKRKVKFYLLSIVKKDLKSSITVFFVALPLSLGIALASNAPLSSGLISAILGGIVVSLISKSPMSVSGAAAGLTTICIDAISGLGSLEHFFLAVSLAGIIQIAFGAFKLGGFTHFIPSAVIKGMLFAIGVILISKQIPNILGYNKPDFWNNTFFNLFTFKHIYSTLESFINSISIGIILITAFTFLIYFLFENYFSKITKILPVSFIVVLSSTLFANALFVTFPDALNINQSQFINIPKDFLGSIKFLSIDSSFLDSQIWKYAVIIAFVASLETLLCLEAIDKIDTYHRVSPQNRELFAQGIGNFLSGIFGGLPITSVIVRSSANLEAGAKTKFSAVLHGVWIVLAISLFLPLINKIPYAVLGVILIKTGYKLANPKLLFSIAKQGREQFLPFLFTLVSILFTDLLIGVVIGFIYAIFFIIKHTYRAGFTSQIKSLGHISYYSIHLANNVSFLNKKKILEFLDQIPEYSIVEINGEESVYIDYDVLEIIENFKQKAHLKHIELRVYSLPSVSVLNIH